MKSLTGVSILLTLIGSNLAFAETLKQRSGDVYKYDVLFTNPTCQKYDYLKPVKTQDGSYVDSKPENTYCTSRDKEATAARDGSDREIGKNESPKHRLMSLINSSDTKELYMTYLSFSDREVLEGLCQRLAEGTLDLTLVLDGTGEQRTIDEDLSKYLKGGESLKDKKVRARVTAELEKDINKLRNEFIKYSGMRNKNKSQEEKIEEITKKLKKMLTKSQYLGSILCSPSKSNEEQIYTRKMINKQKGINWSHTKVFMVNESDEEKVTISFSSANMSSGTTIHHENWHFVTVSPDTYFAKVHSCLKQAELYHSHSRKNFMKFIKDCRGEIDLTEEEDIRVFIAPGEGEEAMDVFLQDIKDSTQVDFAAHRFTLRPLTKALAEAKKNGTKVRMIFDDDMYLAGERRLEQGMRVPNMSMEYKNVLTVLSGKASANLRSNNAEARYMETNHHAHTIHHNKYLILSNDKRVNGKAAVFCGAGNFTKAAFSKKGGATNLENYYYITIPEVVAAFNKQYDYVWNKLATPYGKLPLKDTKPKTK